MASVLVAAILFAAIFNYIFVMKQLRKAIPNAEKRWWYKIARLFSTAGVVLTLLTSFIVIYCLWLFPLYYEWLSLQGLLHAMVCVYLWINVSFYYFAMWLKSPGKALTILELEEEGYSTNRMNICKKCKRVKFLGTHHCAKCDCCVRLMSHHSLIGNNCIGLTNFSYYYSFLLFSFLGEVYAVMQLYGPFKTCFVDRYSKSVELKECEKIGDIPLLFVPHSAAFILITIFLSFHTLLLIVDKSQKEFIAEFKDTSSCVRFAFSVCFKLCKRRLNRHRLKHLMWERKPYWRDLFVPSLNEPPIDLSAEDLIDYEVESAHMI